MNRTRLLRLARDLFAIPTAPYAEHGVADWIRRWCARRGALTVREDPSGNLLVRYRRAPVGRGALLAFGAHMDHPGMRVTGRIDARCVEARYLGGGPQEGLRGARVRIFSRARGGPGVRARVKDVTLGQPLRAVLETARGVRGARDVAPGDFTMFDFPPCARKGEILHTRACDDMAAVVAQVALLDELSRRRVPGECVVFFTRAEEVGLEGAVAMAEEGALPARAKIIGLENSSALAGAKIGGGPVIRVGDRSSVFDPRVTHFLVTVARELGTKRKPFAMQRKLMDGGTCETTAFCAAGHEAGGLCLPLGNYHNIGPKGKPAPEYISLTDLDGMVELMIACVRRRAEYAKIVAAPGQRFKKSYRGIAKRLRKTRER